VTVRGTTAVTGPLHAAVVQGECRLGRQKGGRPAAAAAARWVGGGDKGVGRPERVGASEA
jgi:hypothetical protein